MQNTGSPHSSVSKAVKHTVISSIFQMTLLHTPGLKENVDRDVLSKVSTGLQVKGPIK